VVVGVIWRLMYASDIGVVNPIFSALGLGSPNVLANPGSAFLGVVAVDIWEWTPLLFLIILAGLQSIPQEPLEAARVDGAGAGRARELLLPLLFLPLAIPIIVGGVGASVAAEPGRYLGFLALYDAVFAIISWASFEYVVTE